MEMKRTHHIGYIIMGTVSMILMITCLTGFIVSAASGKESILILLLMTKYGISGVSV